MSTAHDRLLFSSLTHGRSIYSSAGSLQCEKTLRRRHEAYGENCLAKLSFTNFSISLLHNHAIL